MAEGLLRACLEARGVDATVSSTGVSFRDRPASANAVDAMRRRGIDIDPHRSRMLDVDQLTRADLVLCMERTHVREAVILHPPSFPRVFTLKELVRRGEQIGSRGPDEHTEQWLTRAGLGRRPLDHLGASAADDVADPIGLGPDQYEETAAELADLVARLVDLMWPPLTTAVAAHQNRETA